jgi:hypothetical protein
MKAVSLSALCTACLHHPGNIPGTNFCQRLSRLQDHSVPRRIMSMKNSSETLWLVAQCLNKPCAANHVISVLKSPDPSIRVCKAVCSQTSIDLQGLHHDGSAICGNIACMCLLESCSKNRFQVLQLWVFWLFLLFGERPSLDVTSFTCFEFSTVVFNADTGSLNCDARAIWVPACA